MSRPSFQFYPKDWRNNANLRRCSPAARGAWMDVLCVLHDSDEYGLVRWPLKEVANAAGVAIGLVRELVDKSVLKGSDKDRCPAYIYTPRSGRRDGAPVTLVPEQDGPVWFSSRMVKDEYVRTIRGEGTRFGDEGHPSPKPGANRSPNPPFGDGPSSASSSASSTAVIPKEISSSNSPSSAADGLPPLPGMEDPGPRIPDCDHQGVLALWGQHMPTNPQPAKWTAARRAHLQARWRELFAEGKATTRDEALAWFAKFFRYLAKSQFLTGRVTPREAGRKPFSAELGWVVTPERFTECIEGKFHPEA